MNECGKNEVDFKCTSTCTKKNATVAAAAMMTREQ